MKTQAQSEQGRHPAHYAGLDLFRPITIFGIVLFHSYYMCRVDPSHSWLIRFRDFGFPVIVLTSFFVLALSFMRKPEKNFSQFLLTRFVRIGAPFIIWTILYWCFWEVFCRLIKGEVIHWPPTTLILSGYMHLWYLQSIFIGSLLLAPLLSTISYHKHIRLPFSALCFMATIVYALWIRPLLQSHIITAWTPQCDQSLYILITNTVSFFIYVPPALFLAMLADEIDALFRRNTFRLFMLLIVLIAMVVHLLTSKVPFTREVYGLAVFVALLIPLRGVLTKSVQQIAKYSYAIYILHFGINRIIVSALFRAQIEFTPVVIFVISVIVFGISFLVSILLRSLFPWDWFLPLIKVEGGKQQPTGAS